MSLAYEDSVLVDWSLDTYLAILFTHFSTFSGT